MNYDEKQIEENRRNAVKTAVKLVVFCVLLLVAFVVMSWLKTK